MEQSAGKTLTWRPSGKIELEIEVCSSLRYQRGGYCPSTLFSFRDLGITALRCSSNSLHTTRFEQCLVHDRNKTSADSCQKLLEQTSKLPRHHSLEPTTRNNQIHQSFHGGPSSLQLYDPSLCACTHDVF